MFSKIDLPEGSKERQVLYTALWQNLQRDPTVQASYGDTFPQSRDSTEVLYCWKTIDDQSDEIVYSIALLISPRDGGYKKVIEREYHAAHGKDPLGLLH